MLIPRTLFALLLAATAAHAQSDWRTVTDRDIKLTTAEPASASEWRFTQMPPGWHITTRPPAIMYDPGVRASGVFAVETMQILFPGTSNAGYGVFIGGRNLDGANREFIAFLLHRDGRISVESHSGRQVLPVVPPVAAKTFKPAPAVGETSDNLLRVSVAADSVRVSVNGTVALAIPRAGLMVEGHVGFRTGDDLNLHVTTFDYTQRLAPRR
jgi:hypothetical protein